MAKISLSKTIEAAKLAKRTGFPEAGPPVTIPFGALVEHVSTERDTVKFLFLGEPYRCSEDLWLSAIRDPGAKAKPAETTAAAPAPAAQAVQAAAPAAAPSEPPSIAWEPLTSSHFQVARTKVPGGWLVVAGTGVTFLPDPAHEWDGKSLA